MKNAFPDENVHFLLVEDGRKNMLLNPTKSLRFNGKPSHFSQRVLATKASHNLDFLHMEVGLKDDICLRHLWGYKFPTKKNTYLGTLEVIFPSQQQWPGPGFSRLGRWDPKLNLCQALPPARIAVQSYDWCYLTKSKGPINAVPNKCESWNCPPDSTGPSFIQRPECRNCVPGIPKSVPPGWCYLSWFSPLNITRSWILLHLHIYPPIQSIETT